MKKSFVRGVRPQQRAYSPAVITQGADKIIWLAGHYGLVDDDGKSLAGDFEAQCRQTFRNIEKTLAEAGARLSDMVTMTVFLTDARYTTGMTEIRREIFGKRFCRKRRNHHCGFRGPRHDDRNSGRCGAVATGRRVSAEPPLRSSPALAPILLVGDVLEPLHRDAVEGLLHGYVGHRRRRACAAPSLALATNPAPPRPSGENRAHARDGGPGLLGSAIDDLGFEPGHRVHGGRLQFVSRQTDGVFLFDSLVIGEKTRLGPSADGLVSFVD